MVLKDHSFVISSPRGFKAYRFRIFGPLVDRTYVVQMKMSSGDALDFAAIRRCSIDGRVTFIGDLQHGIKPHVITRSWTVNSHALLCAGDLAQMFVKAFEHET